MSVTLRNKMITYRRETALHAAAGYVIVFAKIFFAVGVTAESLRAKKDRKSAISLQRGQFDPKLQVEGVIPPIIFARIVRIMNALQFCR